MYKITKSICPIIQSHYFEFNNVKNVHVKTVYQLLKVH